MKITRSELNKLIESYLQKPQLLTELLNIQRTLNKINPYFENPDERGEEYRVNAEELQALQDTGELAGIINYFRAKQDKIKRDVKKMRPGRRGRYNELEEKIKALEAEMARLNIPIPDSAPEPPPEIITPEPEGDTEPQPGPSGDPYEYKIDKDGELAGSKGCWVTRKRGTSTWKKIKGNEKIGRNWKAIFARLDDEIGGRTNRDIENCSESEPEAPGKDETGPKPSGIDCSKITNKPAFNNLIPTVLEVLSATEEFMKDETIFKQYTRIEFASGTTVQRFWTGYRKYLRDLRSFLVKVKQKCDKGEIIEKDSDLMIKGTNALKYFVGRYGADVEEGAPYYRMNNDKTGFLKVQARYPDGKLASKISGSQSSMERNCRFLLELLEQAGAQPMSESTFRRWAKNAKLL